MKYNKILIKCTCLKKVANYNRLSILSLTMLITIYYINFRVSFENRLCNIKLNILKFCLNGQTILQCCLETIEKVLPHPLSLKVFSCDIWTA